MNSSNKYRDGKIYKIQCKNDDTLTYIGSTISSLKRRLNQHKSAANTSPNRLFYKTVLQSKNKWRDWFIELVEKYPCVSSQELTEREKHHIAKIGNLNSFYKMYECPCGHKMSSQKYIYNHVNSTRHKEYENDFLIDFLFERFKLDKDEVESALEK